MSREPQRLQKILSAAGVASRRAAEKLIQSGRVTVNKEVVTRLGTKADPSKDRVAIDGVEVRANRQKLHVILNKPRGVVSTMSDPQGRKTVGDLVGHLGVRLFHVGRLDLNSDGLIFMTNDGDLAEQLTHPKHGCTKLYQAKVHGIPHEKTLARLRRGVPASWGPHPRSFLKLNLKVERLESRRLGVRELPALGARAPTGLESADGPVLRVVGDGSRRRREGPSPSEGGALRQRPP